MKPILVWIENDLRLSDHAPFAAAAETGAPIVPVFVWNGGEGWADGAASRWWLHHSLEAFSNSLGDAGLPLILRRGDPERILPEMASQLNAAGVFWHERPDPLRAERDDGIQRRLETDGRTVRRFGGALLHNPDNIQTTSGGPYRVFTPFYRRFREEVAVDQPFGRPDFEAGSAEVRGDTLDELGLLPKIDWAGGLRDTWTPGELSAHGRLGAQDLSGYGDRRDTPSEDGTSRLSPHLHFGELSPRQAWHGAGRIEAFRRQLVWRDFAHHLIHHFPETRWEPLNGDFRKFPWRHDEEDLQRWQSGRTGYPMVDAGMRQLWETGWMHNRVRMIVASFLTKHLLHSWRHGQDWFNDTLVDADLANNVFGWQWAGGCGADAQPFFRIFNPITQGQKFDPQGTYVKRWVPELRDVPVDVLFEPWKSDAVPASYPKPIVEHKSARERALAAYQKTRS